MRSQDERLLAAIEQVFPGFTVALAVNPNALKLAEQFEKGELPPIPGVELKRERQYGNRFNLRYRFVDEIDPANPDAPNSWNYYYASHMVEAARAPIIRSIKARAETPKGKNKLMWAVMYLGDALAVQYRTVQMQTLDPAVITANFTKQLPTLAQKLGDPRVFVIKGEGYDKYDIFVRGANADAGRWGLVKPEYVADYCFEKLRYTPAWTARERELRAIEDARIDAVLSKSAQTFTLDLPTWAPPPEIKPPKKAELTGHPSRGMVFTDETGNKWVIADVKRTDKEERMIVRQANDAGRVIDDETHGIPYTIKGERASEKKARLKAAAAPEPPELAPADDETLCQRYADLVTQADVAQNIGNDTEAVRLGDLISRFEDKYPAIAEHVSANGDAYFAADEEETDDAAPIDLASRRDRAEAERHQPEDAHLDNDDQPHPDSPEFA